MIGAFVGADVGGHIPYIESAECAYTITTGASTVWVCTGIVYPVYTDTINHMQKPVDVVLAGDQSPPGKPGKLSDMSPAMRKHIFNE